MTDAAAPTRDPHEIIWPLEHPLAKPIVVGQDTLQVLILREPTGEEVLKFGLLEGLSADQFFPLVASLSATPPPVLMKIGARDILQLGTILSRFFVWAALPPIPSTTASA
ncbi:phage tail assembly protein [Methylobacterium sp. E-046]|uniref:phage tail assembly protein n=1 Tax=Methylobacterium sp. E-046 TaxID=2836576 RepID=UPI001FBB3D3C|nr:phage tail assembly protein [Methylobacterium sp. E-046]MCJ2102456.1 phage tail assembly protein [Methylobacterium sp. E-046]